MNNTMSNEIMDSREIESIVRSHLVKNYDKPLTSELIIEISKHISESVNFIVNHKVLERSSRILNSLS